MTNLSVNVNKIAWLRNARGEGRPDVIELSKILIDCGIQGLTVHPRPDLRHITPDDVYDISSLCLESNIEFNIGSKSCLRTGFFFISKLLLIKSD